MRNQQLDIAKTFLKQEGFDDIPDKTLLLLFDLIKGEPSAVYETGDFVIFTAGMGEMGFGWVQGLCPGGYRIKLWISDSDRVVNVGVDEGSVRALSTTQEAKDYYKVRGQ